jgi:3,2-trans-enoyl-CoA isomerase
MSSAIKDIEKNSKVQSLVLSSSNPSIFSAGLDMKEMYNPDPTRLNEFWTSFQQLFIDLYGSRLATIAAIEGHAPAAGCMLALSCDYRVMCADESFSIGLNEAKFGIAAPPWLGQLMLRTIGFRQGEMALALGTLFNPNDAATVGLVDLIVDRELVLESSYEVAKQWGKIPSHARVATKKLARGPFIADLEDKRREDLDYFTSFVLSEKVQMSLGLYLESLSKRQKRG